LIWQGTTRGVKWKRRAAGKYLPQVFLERFSVGLQQEQVLDEQHAAGKYLLVPWGRQVLACSVVAQTYQETL
jgi:hypothetical protein